MKDFWLEFLNRNSKDTVTVPLSRADGSYFS